MKTAVLSFLMLTGSTRHVTATKISLSKEPTGVSTPVPQALRIDQRCFAVKTIVSMNLMPLERYHRLPLKNEKAEQRLVMSFDNVSQRKPQQGTGE